MKKTLLAISLSSLALIACSKSNQSAPAATAETPASEIVSSEAIAISQTTEISENIATGDNAQTSLDWDGQYKAILPCADCEGIETIITLAPDQGYVISEKYLGTKDANKPIVSQGKFNFDKQGQIITLDKAGDARKYFVAENQLFALDIDGNKITGPSAELYVLKKQLN